MLCIILFHTVTDIILLKRTLNITLSKYDFRYNFSPLLEPPLSSWLSVGRTYRRPRGRTSIDLPKRPVGEIRLFPSD